MENMEMLNKYMPDAIKSFGLNWNNYEPDGGWEYWHILFEEVIPDIQKRISSIHKSVERYDNAIQKFEELRKIGSIISARANDFVDCARSATVTPDDKTTILDILSEMDEEFSFDKWLGATLAIGDFVASVCADFLSAGARAQKDTDKRRRMENFLNSYIRVVENFFIAIMCGYALEWSDTKFKTKILRVAIQAFSACVKPYDDAQYQVKSIPVEDMSLNDYKDFVSHIDTMHKTSVDCLRNMKALQKTVKISGDCLWKSCGMKELINIKRDLMKNPIGMQELRR